LLSRPPPEDRRFGTLELLQLVAIFRWPLWEAYSASQTSSPILRGEGMRSGDRNGRNRGGTIKGDGEWTEEGRKVVKVKVNAV